VEVHASRIIFIAGQTALDCHGAVVGKNDFAAQADEVFGNLGVALWSGGLHGEQSGEDDGVLVRYRSPRHLSRGVTPPPRLPSRCSKCRSFTGPIS
jgi:enamine deaminase RidA (YjgF/YER057c/UK114 family)